MRLWVVRTAREQYGAAGGVLTASDAGVGWTAEDVTLSISLSVETATPHHMLPLKPRWHSSNRFLLLLWLSDNYRHLERGHQSDNDETGRAAAAAATAGGDDILASNERSAARWGRGWRYTGMSAELRLLSNHSALHVPAAGRRARRTRFHHYTVSIATLSAKKWCTVNRHLAGSVTVY